MVGNIVSRTNEPRTIRLSCTPHEVRVGHRGLVREWEGPSERRWVQRQSWLWLCFSSFPLKWRPSPGGSERIWLAHGRWPDCTTNYVMWQRPCGLNNWIWRQIILQWTSCHLSLDKLYWSLTINRVLHQLAAMPLSARGNNHICVVCRPVASLGAGVCVVVRCNFSRMYSTATWHCDVEKAKGEF